jgi:membrane protease YdiL (CAAX protease family)
VSRGGGGGTVSRMPPATRLATALAVGALALLAGTQITRIGAGFPSDSIEALVWGALGVESLLALAACAGALLARRPLIERLGLRRGRLGAPALAALVVGMLALSHALDSILSLSGLREHSSLAELAARLNGARGRALWLAIIGLAVVPGIAEELFCRGFVQRGLRAWLSAPVAVTSAALVFGALHIDPVHALFAAALGLYLGTAAEWADSIGASILCHVVNNGVSVVLMAGYGASASVSGASIPFALALCAACLWLVRRQTGAPPGTPPVRDAR